MSYVDAARDVAGGEQPDLKLRTAAQPHVAQVLAGRAPRHEVVHANQLILRGQNSQLQEVRQRRASRARCRKHGSDRYR